MFRIQLTSNLADQNRQNIQLVRHNEKQKKKRSHKRAYTLSVTRKVYKSFSKSFSNISVKIMVGPSDSHLKERIKPIIVTL